MSRIDRLNGLHNADQPEPFKRKDSTPSPFFIPPSNARSLKGRCDVRQSSEDMGSILARRFES
jgi:hypothetical protein